MTPEEASKKTLEQLLQLLNEGQAVEIHPPGSCMFAILKEGRDSVMIQALDGTVPKRGDILLYQRSSGLLVLHRVCRTRKEGYYFVGDNQTEVEGPLDFSQLLGIVTQIRRKGRLFSVKHPVYQAVSRAWLFVRPIRHLISRPIGILWRAIQNKLRRFL